jgi:hypothetical protein
MFFSQGIYLKRRLLRAFRYTKPFPLLFNTLYGRMYLEFESRDRNLPLEETFIGDMP